MHVYRKLVEVPALHTSLTAAACTGTLFGFGEKRLPFAKLPPKSEACECPWILCGLHPDPSHCPGDGFLLAVSSHFSVPAFRLRDKTRVFIRCAFFLVPTLSPCPPVSGTACSPRHWCLCPGWVGTLAALLPLPQSWVWKCASRAVASLAVNVAPAFFKHRGVLQVT